VFEKATRMKLRFPFRGSITVEDLWDLSPKELNNVFKELRSTRKVTEEESLIETQTDENLEVNLQMDIVRHVFEVKRKEAEVAKTAAERKLKKQRIREILAAKQDQGLQEKSEEDLRKLLSELD